jgi:hypothetical protein
MPDKETAESRNPQVLTDNPSAGQLALPPPGTGPYRDNSLLYAAGDVAVVDSQCGATARRYPSIAAAPTHLAGRRVKHLLDETTGDTTAGVLRRSGPSDRWLRRARPFEAMNLNVAMYDDAYLPGAASAGATPWRRHR